MASEIIILDFKCYSQITIKSFLDKIYEVNVGPFNLRDGIEMIKFIYDCDHYDEIKFPWHFNAINDLWWDSTITYVVY